MPDVEPHGVLLGAEAFREELQRPYASLDPLRVGAGVDDRGALLYQAHLVDELSVNDELIHVSLANRRLFFGGAG